MALKGVALVLLGGSGLGSREQWRPWRWGSWDCGVGSRKEKQVSSCLTLSCRILSSENPIPVCVHTAEYICISASVHKRLTLIASYV